jgi:hypothetical protein
MVARDLDKIVEVENNQEKNKSFKEPVKGGTNKSSGDVMMVGKDSSLPKSDQPTTARDMSNNP